MNNLGLYQVTFYRQAIQPSRNNLTKVIKIRTLNSYNKVLHWFMKSVQRTLRTKDKEFAHVGDEDCVGKVKNIISSKADHIIYLSEGFDLSPLFEEKKKMEKE